jgi:hypothetical protein
MRFLERPDDKVSGGGLIAVPSTGLCVPGMGVL